MENIQYFGFFAGALSVVSALPQIVKILRTKKTKDISLSTYIILNTAAFLWVIYGILIGQIPIIITNFIFLTFNLTILFLKIRHG